MRGRNASRRCDARTLYYTPMSAKDAAREAEQGTGRAASSGAVAENGADAVNVHYDTRLPELPWSRRRQIPVIVAGGESGVPPLGPAPRFDGLGRPGGGGGCGSGEPVILGVFQCAVMPVVW